MNFINYKLKCIAYLPKFEAFGGIFFLTSFCPIPGSSFLLQRRHKRRQSISPAIVNVTKLDNLDFLLNNTYNKNRQFKVHFRVYFCLKYSSVLHSVPFGPGIIMS